MPSHHGCYFCWFIMNTYILNVYRLYYIYDDKERREPYKYWLTRRDEVFRGEKVLGKEDILYSCQTFRPKKIVLLAEHSFCR